MRRDFRDLILLGGVALMLVSACTQQAPVSPGPTEDFASLVKNLRDAGATVAEAGTVQQDFFSVDGKIIKVNGADVQVFEYAKSETAEAEAGKVSPDGSSIGTTMVTWVAPPHFFKAGRIIVLYVGAEQTVMNLLEDELGPQFAGRGLEGEKEIKPAPITEVSVALAESFPVQVFVNIKGTLADSCTTINEVETQREGNDVNIEVTTQRPVGAICAQVITPFEKNVALGSDFISGQTYTVRVNDAQPVVFTMQ